MSLNDPTAAEPVACPYLGLADDPRTRFSFAAQAHRCYAGSKPASIDLAFQGSYCLSSRYPTCDRYHPPKAAANTASDPRLSVAAAVAAEAEALAEATGAGQPLPTAIEAMPEPEPTAPEIAAEPTEPVAFAPEPEQTAIQPEAAAPEPTPIEVVAADPEPQRTQAIWTRHGWSTPETELAVSQAVPTAEPTASPTEPTAPEIAAAPTPEPEPAAEQTEPAADQAEPAAGSVEPEPPPEPAAEPRPSGKGRRSATPPPTAWKTAKTSSVLAAIFPSYELATAPRPSGPEAVDADPVAAESVAIVPPKGRRPTTPPPTAWKSAKTVSILESILPPIEPIGAVAPAEPPAAPEPPTAPEPPVLEAEATTVATPAAESPSLAAEPTTAAEPTMPAAEAAATVAATEPLVPAAPEVVAPPLPPVATPPTISPSAVWPPAGSRPASREAPPAIPPRKRPWFADATPVADTRARLPESAPLPGVPGARPAATRDRRRFRRVPQGSGNRRNVRRRALLLLLVLAVAALAAAVATGSLDRWLPAGLLPGAVALPSATAVVTPFVDSTSPPATAVASPTLTTSPTPIPSTAQATPVIHVVQRGESLTSIAAHYGVTPQEIRRVNDLKDANLLRVGQKLIIPTDGQTFVRS